VCGEADVLAELLQRAMLRVIAGLMIVVPRAAQELEEVRGEADALAELLELRQGALAATLDGGFPELRASVWSAEAAVQAAVQALTPPMAENRKRAEDLLREALLLRAALDAPGAPGLLERLLPKRYKQFQKGISGRT
jgi:MoxR-like ATPase